MSQTNPLWGAPRIHGELLKVGIDVPTTRYNDAPMPTSFSGVALWFCSGCLMVMSAIGRRTGARLEREA